MNLEKLSSPIIGYYDIPEIKSSVFKNLVEKKKRVLLTKEENIKMDKYTFQNLLINENEDCEESLWCIFQNNKNLFIKNHNL